MINFKAIYWLFSQNLWKSASLWGASVNSINGSNPGCVRGARIRMHLATLEDPLALFVVQLRMQCLPKERRCSNEKVWSGHCLSHPCASEWQVVQKMKWNLALWQSSNSSLITVGHVKTRTDKQPSEWVFLKPLASTEFLFCIYKIYTNCHLLYSGIKPYQC